MHSVRDQTDQVLEGLGLRSIDEQDSRTLSGGQRQLVAIGRALVITHEVMLFDEPTSHLAPANVARVESLIPEQNRCTGTTVIWVTLALGWC